MNNMPVLLAASLFILLSAIVIVHLSWTRAVQRLPPGPRPLMFCGTPVSVYKLNSSPRELFEALRSKYGDLATIWLGSNPIVIISCPQAAHHLLERDATATSSRPMHNNFRQKALPSRIVLEPSGQEFTRLRRLYDKFLRKPHHLKFRHIQHDESDELVASLLRSPEKFLFECDRFSINVLFRAMYNSRLGAEEDSIIKHTYKIWETIYKYFLPGSAILDYLPALTRLPTWLQPWNAIIAVLKNREAALHQKYLAYIQDQIHYESPNIGHSLLNMLGDESTARQFVVTFLAMALGAASDTTSAVLQLFFKAMALHPQVLREAQAELDKVVGSSRLPSWADWPDLPYVTALINELHRWAPVAVAGMPHATTRELEYKDFIVPKGTILIPNITALSSSTELCSDPDVFDPTRLLLGHGEGRQKHLSGMRGQHRHHFQFGFGRRFCPGADVAEASLFIAIAKILWGFDILKLSEEKELDMTERRAGLVRKPKPFKVGIVCRDEAHERVLRGLLDRDA